jgi:acetolactate synthase-1/2/3 large subunit
VLPVYDALFACGSIRHNNFIVLHMEDLPRIVREAFHLATTGRPGPVLIDLPENVMTARLPSHRNDAPLEPTRICGFPGIEPIPVYAGGLLEPRTCF